MIDGLSAVAATQQRSMLPASQFGDDQARDSVGKEMRPLSIAAASDDGFGPSVLLPEAVKAIEDTSETRSASEKQSTPNESEGPDKASNAASDAASETTDESDSPYELTEEEEEVVDELEERDAEVRAHENAHASAGGQYAGAPTYSYTTGPDGKQYATGGSVSIDTSTVSNDPQATITKMATVIRAALAPAEPSAQDRNVAQDAQRKMAAAQVDLARQTNQPEDEEDDDEAAEGSGRASTAAGGTASNSGSGALVNNTTTAAIQQAVSAYQRGSGLIG